MLKKALYLLPLALFATACSNDDEPEIPRPDYELRTLTFEDADAKFTAYTINGVNIATWSDLIDDVQYGGTLLYNDFTSSDYAWCDGGNTDLESALVANGPFWNGGMAVSDYYQAIGENESVDYTLQLGVGTGASDKAGHNGSRNFCVVNASVSSGALPVLAFADGEARVIDHMYVTNTSYTYNALCYGNSFCAAATDTSWFKIVATGYDANDEVTGTAEFMLCNGVNNVVNEWTKFDLSGLGEVVKVNFGLEGSDDMYGEWGLNTPSYFAIDDVAVRFPAE